MNYREEYEKVKNYLGEEGYSWVADQVHEELAVGRLSEERISTLAEVKNGQPRILSESSFRKGQPADFVKRNDYSDKEALILLLEAARRAICDTAVMAAELRRALKVNQLDGVVFEAEQDGGQRFSLAVDGDDDGAKARESGSRMDQLIDEVRRT